MHLHESVDHSNKKSIRVSLFSNGIANSLMYNFCEGSGLCGNLVKNRWSNGVDMVLPGLVLKETKTALCFSLLPQDLA